MGKDLKHLEHGLSRLLLNEFEEFSEEIVIYIKKFKNGKTTFNYKSIKSKILRKEVEFFLENSFPITC